MEAKLQKFFMLIGAAGPFVLKLVPGPWGIAIGGVLTALGGLGALYHPAPSAAGSLPPPPVVLALVALALSSCATAGTCTQPLTGQAIQDGAGVLTCAASGKTLAACEDAQLAVEAGQLTQDLLVCGEVAVAAAASGAHTTAGK